MSLTTWYSSLVAKCQELDTRVFPLGLPRENLLRNILLKNLCREEAESNQRIQEYLRYAITDKECTPSTGLQSNQQLVYNLQAIQDRLNGGKAEAQCITYGAWVSEPNTPASEDAYMLSTLNAIPSSIKPSSRKNKGNNSGNPNSNSQGVTKGVTKSAQKKKRVRKVIARLKAENSALLANPVEGYYNGNYPVDDYDENSYYNSPKGKGKGYNNYGGGNWGNSNNWNNSNPKSDNSTT